MNTEILVSSKHELFKKNDLYHAVFPSDYRQIQYFTLLLVQHSRPKADERLLLEQQVSEIIKNAVKHGNHCDSTKEVKIWYRFTATEARLIVQDEGTGFQDIEKWNLFNSKRQEYIDRQDFAALMSYASWRTATSDKYDGGNAMFAALEYWNMGVVYSDERNCIAVGKKFPADFMEMETEGDE
jgi:hypothetical protein